MAQSYRNNAIIVGVVTLLACIGLVSLKSLAADSAPISEGSNVTVMYQITVPGEGFEVKDISQFVQGKHEMLPALERVVTGMKSGDEKKVDLPPEQGFGPYDPNKKKTVPRTELPGGTKEGDILQDRAGNQATVAHLSDSSAVMDYNHPLAGKPLSVKIKVLRVDNPS
jgi:FKBP-type peptidyl-prolyl cis-trans isomerase 2